MVYSAECVRHATNSNAYEVNPLACHVLRTRIAEIAAKKKQTDEQFKEFMRKVLKVKE